MFDLLGDSTPPRTEERLTLNPAAHIDGVGILMFLLLGWSWAKPVRIRPENLKSRRWGETAVPLSNFLLALLFFVLRRLLPQGIGHSFCSAVCR